MSFNPMLATNVKFNQIDRNYLGSIKLEGSRGELFAETGLLSRQLKPVPNIYINERMDGPAQIATEMGLSLDGEFYLHGWTFNRIDSAFRNENNPDGQMLQFWVHDAFIHCNPDAPFGVRWEVMQAFVARCNDLGYNHIQLCKQWPIGTPAGAQQAYEWAVANGYEGIVLKDPNGAYKFGRSTLKQGLFLRIKPEDPYDGVILQIVERQTNLVESEVNELGFLKKRQDKDMKEGAGIAQTAITYCPALARTIRVSLTRGLQDENPTDKGPSRRELWENRQNYEGHPVKFVGIPVEGMAPRSPRYDTLRHDLEPLYAVHHDSEALLITFDCAEYDAWIADQCDVIDFTILKELLSRGYRLGRSDDEINNI